jgi:hypothetical protein
VGRRLGWNEGEGSWWKWVLFCLSLRLHGPINPASANHQSTGRVRHPDANRNSGNTAQLSSNLALRLRKECSWKVDSLLSVLIHCFANRWSRSCVMARKPGEARQGLHSYTRSSCLSKPQRMVNHAGLSEISRCSRLGVEEVLFDRLRSRRKPPQVYRKQKDYVWSMTHPKVSGPSHLEVAIGITRSLCQSICP